MSARNRRTAIRSGEESVLCSTALLRRGFISADVQPDGGSWQQVSGLTMIQSSTKAASETNSHMSVARRRVATAFMARLAVAMRVAALEIRMVVIA